MLAPPVALAQCLGLVSPYRLACRVRPLGLVFLAPCRALACRALFPVVALRGCPLWALLWVHLALRA